MSLFGCYYSNRLFSSTFASVFRSHYSHCFGQHFEVDFRDIAPLFAVYRPAGVLSGSDMSVFDTFENDIRAVLFVFEYAGSYTRQLFFTF